MSVVPPPMSTSATPSSFSSSVRTDSLAASCSTTVSATSTPARFTQVTMFCVELWLPVMMWTFTSSRAPVIPTGAPMPSCSSTTKSCGRTWRISRPVGSDTALAASMARRTSSRVISRVLPATAMTPRLLKPLMCGPDSPRCTESISTPAISSASSIAFLIESTAASRLTTTPRRMPRDSATPSPTTSRPRPSMISPTTAVTFDVPTSSPTRYRSFRATRVPLLLLPGFVRGPDVNPILEPQIDVVDRFDTLAQRRRQLEVRLQARQELVLAELNHHRVAAQDHLRVVRVADVNLREPPRHRRLGLDRGDDARRQIGAQFIGHRRAVVW